jgi:hypothetical protein
MPGYAARPQTPLRKLALKGSARGNPMPIAVLTRMTSSALMLPILVVAWPALTQVAPPFGVNDVCNGRNCANADLVRRMSFVRSFDERFSNDREGHIKITIDFTRPGRPVQRGSRAYADPRRPTRPSRGRQDPLDVRPRPDLCHREPPQRTLPSGPRQHRFHVHAQGRAPGRERYCQSLGRNPVCAAKGLPSGRRLHRSLYLPEHGSILVPIIGAVTKCYSAASVTGLMRFGRGGHARRPRQRAGRTPGTHKLSHRFDDSANRRS